MAKQLSRPEFEDFEIKDGGAVVGWVRIKASGILWKPKGKHSWHRVSIEDFSAYAEEHGTKQDK
jgi:hypothetical protein